MQTSLFCACAMLLVMSSASVVAQSEENKQPADPQKLEGDCPPAGKTRETPSAQDWRYMLAGSRLLLREYADGRRLEESFDFCSNGVVYNRLKTRDSRHNDDAFAYGVSAQQVSGIWTVVEVDGANHLLLRKRDKEKRLLLEDRNGATFLNGKRYFMLENQRCY